MASSSFHFMLLCSLLLISSTTSLAQSPKPKALILPATKDSTTLQYLTKIKQRTPLVPITLTLDLGGPYFWVDCEQGYTTSTYRPARCESPLCKLVYSAGCLTECSSPQTPGCTNNTCTLLPSNSVTDLGFIGTLGSDVVSFQSQGKTFTVPQFPFVCGTTTLLKNLATGVKGMAGLGRTNISFPYQFDSTFGINKKFSVCLSSTLGNGFVVFGSVDIAPTPLVYTPLLINPISTAAVYSVGEPSAEYFIGVKSIKINDKIVRIDPKLSSINMTDGIGGTKISTVNPYTVLHRRIFKAVVKTFEKEVKATRVESVAPFGACFNAKEMSMASTGPAVPTIDFVLQSEHVYWRMYGRNSIVQVSNKVWCLGFVDGGSNPETSIVLGGHQIEDNWLEFDLASSNVAFSALINRKTTCASYRFA